MNKDLLDKHLEDLMSRLEPGRKNVIVYKGFPLDFIIGVSEVIPFATEPTCRLDNGKIDLRRILNNSRSLVEKIVNNDLPDNCLLLYEEFYLLSRKVDLSVFRGTFILVENDLYNAYPNESTTRTVDFEEEINRNNVDALCDDLFNAFYAYSARAHDINVVQYLQVDHDTQQNVIQLSFFGSLIQDRELIVRDAFEADLGADDTKVLFRSEEYDGLKWQLYLNVWQPNAVRILVNAKVEADEKAARELKCLEALVESVGGRIGVYRLKSISRPGYRAELTEILATHWNSSAFRELSFYEQPAVSEAKLNITQGEIIEDVIAQVEGASGGQSFRDIFLTSPTGSGKSVGGFKFLAQQDDHAGPHKGTASSAPCAAAHSRGFAHA